MTNRRRRQLSPQSAPKMACGWVLSLCLSSVGAQTPATEMPTSTRATASAPQTQAAPASKAWQQLTPGQKQALAPLGAQWGALTAQQQNKWLVLSQNFAQMSVTDQITMHARMADWVALSPRQRTLARLNFNTLQSVPKEDKKAKWEAYQALSAEEKRVLSAGSAMPPKSAAPTAKPLPPYRQVITPEGLPSGNQAVSTTSIDRKTLLPRPPTLAAPPPSAPTPLPIPQPGAPETARQATESAPS